MFARAYRVFGYFGLFSIFGVMIYGFRHDPAAPWSDLAFDVGIYGMWALIHLLMTRDWFKRPVYGSRKGSLFERQVYISVTVVTWLTVLWFHAPVPGSDLALPGPIRFAAAVAFLLFMFSFFEGSTFAVLDGLIGAPGSQWTHSHGAETPLLTEGQYAQVRHPMYRAALGAGLCSLVIHPNLGQLLWVMMIGTTFIAFIPIEEQQLIEARGDAYRTYMQRTPYRLVRGVW